MANSSSDELTAYVPRVLLSWPEDVRFRAFEGTLVHIDISGFTAMSERLAAKGKVGAEEVAGVLTAVFTELLTVASDLGADMLKFGGDALLLLFTGPDHPLRAVRASGEMRSRLRTVGKVNTPAGRVSLRMTVGVHSGRLQFIVVGGSHRELIVAGDAATEVVAMEESAEAGEIVLSAATAAALPEQLIGERRGAGLLLARMPPPMNFVQDPVGNATDPSQFVPPALREAARSSSGDGEHRIITAAFVKFHGTDEILLQEGEEALCAKLDGLVQTTQQAAEEYGVAFLASDVDRNGGKIILTAGSPITTGADEERMLRTVRAIVDRHQGLPIKVGVNRGPAFSGDVGAPFRRSFTVIGDAVNLAARVMAQAEDGSIFSTGGALDHSATIFATEAVEPFYVKGKTAPVEAWRVGAVAGRRSAHADKVPLVGRDDQLEEALAAVGGESSTGLLEVLGPSGIGKSRFVRELRARHPEADWHFAAAELFEASSPYFPYQRLLREVLGIDLQASREDAAEQLRSWIDERLPDLVPWLPLISTVMDLPSTETDETAQIDAKFRRARTHETIEALLDAALPSPAVLIIEDAHWLDEASRELTAHLGSHASGAPWLLVLARRSGDFAIEVANSVQIELGPLTDDDAYELADVLLEDSPMLQSQLRPIIERAAGNPLYLSELVNAARNGGDTEELPDNVEALVLARIDRLDPVHRKLLRYASVVGTSFDIDLLIAAIEDLEPSVCDLTAWDSLNEFIVGRSTGDMRFRQELFQDVAYTGLPYRTRRLLHERVGRALEKATGAASDTEAERLSVHFMRAEVFDKAWHYSVVAGDDAKAKNGNADAVAFYARALRAARHLDLAGSKIAEVAETLGDAAEIAGMYDDADHAFGDARRRLADEDHAAMMRLMRKQGLIREKRGAYTQALSWFSRALHRGADDAAREDVRLRLAYAGVRYRQAKYNGTIKWAAEALRAAEAAGDLDAAAHAYRLLGLAHRQLGNTDKSLEYLRRALDIYDDRNDLVGQADTLNNLGGVDYRRANWDLASQRWERETETRRTFGDVVLAAMAENNIANIRSDQGRWEEADNLFHQVRRVLRAAGFSLGVSVVTSNLGRVAARSGRFEEAENMLNEAIAELEAIGAGNFVAEAKAHLVEAYLFAGKTAACERVAVPLLSELENRAGTNELQALLHRVFGYVQLLKGDIATALSCFEESLRIAQAENAYYEEALTLEAMSHLPDTAGVDAAASMTGAQEIFDRLGVVRTPEVPLAALTG